MHFPGFNLTCLGIYSGCHGKVCCWLLSSSPPGSPGNSARASDLCLHTTLLVTWFFILLLCRRHPGVTVVRTQDHNLPPNLAKSNLSPWFSHPTSPFIHPGASPSYLNNLVGAHATPPPHMSVVLDRQSILFSHLVPRWWNNLPTPEQGQPPLSFLFISLFTPFSVSLQVHLYQVVYPPITWYLDCVSQCC